MLHCGLMSLSRRFISSSFICPTVVDVACNWRLVLEIQISSKSTNTRLPTPLRQRASAAQEPTPPRPTTVTVDAASLSTISKWGGNCEEVLSGVVDSVVYNLLYFLWGEISGEFHYPRTIHAYINKYFQDKLTLTCQLQQSANAVVL